MPRPLAPRLRPHPGAGRGMKPTVGPASPPGLTLPHTSVEKAALCDGVLPFLTGLKDAIWAITAKHPEALAGATAIAMGQMLLLDVRRLLRGEPMAHYVEGLTIAADRADRLGLALKLLTMETGALAFRKRYFGWHPLLKRPAWYLAGPHGIEAARRLLPRDAAQPGDDVPGVPSPEMQELRAKLVLRIMQKQQGLERLARPLPLHDGSAETSKEIVFSDWPGVE